MLSRHLVSTRTTGAPGNIASSLWSVVIQVGRNISLSARETFTSSMKAKHSNISVETGGGPAACAVAHLTHDGGGVSRTPPPSAQASGSARMRAGVAPNSVAEAAAKTVRPIVTLERPISRGGRRAARRSSPRPNRR